MNFFNGPMNDFHRTDRVYGYFFQLQFIYGELNNQICLMIQMLPFHYQTTISDGRKFDRINLIDMIQIEFPFTVRYSANRIRGLKDEYAHSRNSFLCSGIYNPALYIYVLSLSNKK